MTKSTVLSTDELIQLLKEGKVKEFNKLRPRAQQENSERFDDAAKKALSSGEAADFFDFVKDQTDFPDYISMDGVDLSGLNLTGANLSGIDFSEASFVGADLSKTNLANCDFHLADLTRANLAEANVFGADFWEAKLAESDWSQTKCVGLARFAGVAGLSNEQQEIILNAIRNDWR